VLDRRIQVLLFECIFRENPGAVSLGTQWRLDGILAPGMRGGAESLKLCRILVAIRSIQKPIECVGEVLRVPFVGPNKLKGHYATHASPTQSGPLRAGQIAD